MRCRCPNADRGQAGLAARFEHYTDDAGGTLVAGPGQADLIDQVGVGGNPGQRNRLGVGYAAYEGTEQHHLFDIDLAEHLGDNAAERFPAQVGLVAEDQYEVVILSRFPNRIEQGVGPGQTTGAAFVDLHVRPLLLEIEELLGLDGGKRTLGGGLPDEIGNRPR